MLKGTVKKAVLSVVRMQSSLLHGLMKIFALLLSCAAVLCIIFTSHVQAGTELTDSQYFLTSKIPPRPSGAMTGSEFARFVSGMDTSHRERAVVEQLLKGNIPDFLRKLSPLQFHLGFKNGKSVTATIFAMPDYLAIGSDLDFLLVPMNLYSAVRVALEFGFVLPTKKIVDAIFRESAVHYTPEPMTPGPQMSSTGYYVKHNREICDQRLSLGYQLGALVSGHKKDVVISNRLVRNVGKIAIYGWHRLSGVPIQPLSTVHDAGYEDYSHGIRLVSNTILIDNEKKSIYDVLQDPKLASLLSDEGAINGIHQFLSTCR